MFQRLVTHNILAINHSRTGPHTVILLTPMSTRLATASINAQTHLRWVFGSTALADTLTAEHPNERPKAGACHRPWYWREHIPAKMARLAKGQTLELAMTDLSVITQSYGHSQRVMA
jgi:hypothetical protein